MVPFPGDGGHSPPRACRAEFLGGRGVEARPERILQNMIYNFQCAASPKRPISLAPREPGAESLSSRVAPPSVTNARIQHNLPPSHLARPSPTRPRPHLRDAQRRPSFPLPRGGADPPPAGKLPKSWKAQAKLIDARGFAPALLSAPLPPPRARGPPCSATEIHSILDCGPQAGTAMAEGSKSPAPGGSLARTEPRHDCLSFAALPVAARHSTPPKVCGMPPPEE